MLSLITTYSPMTATAIGGIASAYNSGKNYSPHFKNGAEYLERTAFPPIANAVSHVGRKTGVENTVRWFLRRHKPSDSDAGDRGHYKRRRMMRGGKDAEAARSTSDLSSRDEERRISIDTVDTLPAYNDDQASPEYSRVALYENQGSSTTRSRSTGPLQHVIVSTSGLAIAMKDESLKSLKHCLVLVRTGNEGLRRQVEHLTATIQEYESHKAGENESAANGSSSHSAQTADRTALLARMTDLRDTVLKSLSESCLVVSQYTGNALPENAQKIVKGLILSLIPKHGKLLDQLRKAQPDTVDHEVKTVQRAQLAYLFAKEGLQTMTQVSDVLNRTILSAEEWLDKWNKQEAEGGSSAADHSDHAMTGVEPLPQYPRVVDHDMPPPDYPLVAHTRVAMRPAVDSDVQMT